MSHGTQESQPELSPGDVCDEYRILSLIAAGGMGDVYEAVHEPSGRKVAVKCLKVRHRNKEDARARMKMEAVVLSELQHENLVKVYDAGVTDAGMVWFAMERLHGQTLRDIVYRGGQLPIPDALHYASEIADGADAVHDVNVIHRDLKPENVFVTSDNVVKVLDLGTGKFTGYGLNSTDRMRVIGTTAYMSPEQIKGLRVDARADVYALGLILYEMIAGRHALISEDGAGLPQGVEQVAVMQLQLTPRPLAEIAPRCPRYVSAIVDRAIAKDRDLRFPNMAALSRELRAARKRYVAESQFEGASGPRFGEDLREKFGAPPRATPLPVRVAGSAESDTVADAPRCSVDEFPTEVKSPSDMTVDGATPPPGYVPTVLLSSSSIPGIPADRAMPDASFGDAMPFDDWRNQPTQTNPIGFSRSEPPPPVVESVEIDWAPRPWFAFARHPFVRRAVATLGLGAIIGVPPAVLGVVWARHLRAPAAALFGNAPALPATTTVNVAPPTAPTANTAVDVAPVSASAASGQRQGDPPAWIEADSRAKIVASPVAHPATAEAAPSRVPRARPKTPAAASSAPLANERPRRPEIAAPAPPIPTSESTSRTILPPSGL
jgi:serine/threonine-protein kinase